MKRIFKIVGIIFLVLTLGIGGFAFYIYRQVANTVEDIHVELDTEDVRDTELDISRGEPFSVLLLGVDRDAGSTVGRSDTMMVVTVNPNEGSSKILSIARDTRVEIVGRNFLDKINHAFAFGGAEMSINTVQNFLNIPIDFYVEMEMNGLVSLVDAVGGVEVENNLAFSQDGYTFPAGTVQLTGDSALAFIRMRRQDPRGDFGRQERQRMIVEAVVGELASVAVTNFQGILDTVSEYMRTDLTMDDIISMSLNHRAALGRIEQFDMRGNSQIINRIYYQVIPEEQRLEVSTKLRQHLELE